MTIGGAGFVPCVEQWFEFALTCIFNCGVAGNIEIGASQLQVSHGLIKFDRPMPEPVRISALYVGRGLLPMREEAPHSHHHTELRYKEAAAFGCFLGQCFGGALTVGLLRALRSGTSRARG